MKLVARVAFFTVSSLLVSCQMNTARSPQPSSSVAVLASSKPNASQAPAFTGATSPKDLNQMPQNKPDFNEAPPVSGPLNILIADGNVRYRLRTSETPSEPGDILLDPAHPESWSLPNKAGFRQGAYEQDKVALSVNQLSYFEGRKWDPNLVRVIVLNPDHLMPLAEEIKAEIQPLAENHYYLRAAWPISSLAQLEADVRKYNSWSASPDDHIRTLIFDSLDAARVYAFFMHLSLDDRVTSANLVETGALSPPETLGDSSGVSFPR